MFQGTIPVPLRAIVHEHAGLWPGDDVYVGCSGNFTIERTLDGRFRGARQLHGNDVQGYSCALGWWLSGQPLNYHLRDDFQESLGWLEPYLDDPTDTMATLMLGTRFLPWVGKTGIYFQRMLAATRDQWPGMHAKTVDKLRGVQLRLGSFYAGDVRDYLATAVPTDAPVAMFPPFWASGYEKMFAGIDDCFEWPKPAYDILDEDGKEKIIDLVRDRPHWLLGLHVQRDDLRAHLAGVVQVTNRNVPIYVYTSHGPSRIVLPNQQTAPVNLPKIGVGDELGDRMTLHPLTPAQFNGLRSQFLSKKIPPGMPLLACAVAVDRQLIGAFAYLGPAHAPSCAYLMSDFPVSWTRYRRLSKLIILAAISSETQLLLQRAVSRRISAWSTTAWTDNPNSSKYGRGIPGARLEKRTHPSPDGQHEYQLQYGGPIGAQDLQAALAYWKAKHGGDLRDE